jgi:Ca2+-binding RTX toxin-like protein
LFATESAIKLAAYGSSVENDGRIASLGYGIELGGANAGTLSQIHNTGAIRAESIAIHKFSGAESLYVENSGTIKGTDLSFHIEGTGVITIDNTGTITGQAILGDGNDVYNGRSGTFKSVFESGGGADTLRFGKEANQIFAEAGNDKIEGGRGADLMSGGSDADTFIYRSASDSTVSHSGQDTILDFTRSEHDTLDLQAIDASSKASGNQTFDFIGKQAFTHHAGELRYEIVSGDTHVLADINGDGKADFEIHLEDAVKFQASDFAL